MAFDITTFLQAFTDTHTIQTATLTQTPDSQAEPGAFDALMAEYAETMQIVDIPVDAEEQTVTFSGNNTLAQSVLEILAGTLEEGETPSAEVPSAADTEDGDGVIWPEDTEPEQQDADVTVNDELETFAEHLLTDEGIDDIPEGLRGKLARIIDNVAEILTQENWAEASPLVRILSAFSERLTSDSTPAQVAEAAPTENAETAGTEHRPSELDAPDVLDEHVQNHVPARRVQAFSSGNANPSDRAATSSTPADSPDFTSDAGEMPAADITVTASLTLPELRGELGRVIQELADTLAHEDGAEEHPVIRMLASLFEDLTPSRTEHEDEESADDARVHAANVELAGLAGVVVPQLVQSQAPEKEQPEITDAPSRTTQARQVRTSASRNTGTPEDSQEVQDNTQEVRPSFREVFADRNTEREGTSQNATPGQDQNEGQPRDDANTPPATASRSRTDTRRTASVPAQAESTSSSGTRRTDSRSDFASFFQGVLTARRTASTSSPMPLDLRSTANFTQAVALREGITNIVRFIRADGVQKARVVVDPPALGRISVELTSGTSGVEASIKVASEQIRQLVQDQLTELRMNLSQQGVQVAEFTVDVFTGQQDNSGQQQNNPQQQERGVFDFAGSPDEDDTEEFRVDLEEGLLWWVA